MSWEDNVKRVVPYVPGEQPKSKVIKLNTNENPYPVSPEVIAAAKQFDTDRLRLYPDPEASVLVDAIAERYNLSSDQVVVGVGSDDVISTRPFLSAVSIVSINVCPIFNWSNGIYSGIDKSFNLPPASTISLPRKYNLRSVSLT